MGMNDDYSDIINLQRPAPRKHLPMARSERASQFAAFDALSGYNEIINETSRETSRKIELDENEQEILDIKLRNALLDTDKEYVITYYRQDKLKSGGEYLTTNCRLVKLNKTAKSIQLSSGESISISDIIDIE